MRKNLLINEEIYHIVTRSIAGFKIFNRGSQFSRMIETMRYYQREKPDIKFSKFMQLEGKSQLQKKDLFLRKKKLVEILAYCLMPTHLHLIVKQLKQSGVSKFMNNILNSYSRYFNTKHNRKGPLWETRFKNILVERDEQLLHLTRYIHLNPVTAGYVDKPEDWPASSYNEYLSKVTDGKKICKYDDILDINILNYKKFVDDRISYQRELAKIKYLLLD